MKLVVYIYKKFFTIFLSSLFFFVLVLCLTDLFLNLWEYISKNASVKQIMTILILYIPKAAWYAVPISVLFSTAYLLSDLYAKNELLAIFASGISLFRFSSPLLIVAFFMSILLFCFEDKIVVSSYAKKMSMQEAVLHKEQSLNNSNIVIMADEGRIIWKASHYDEDSLSLSDVTVLFRNKEKSFLCLITAPYAQWNDDSWEFINSVCYTKNENGEGFICSKPKEEYLSLLIEPPETFRKNTTSVEEVNVKDAREYIHRLKKAGLPYAESLSLYYKKYSFPFVVFIVVFLAVGLSGKTRKNVLIISLALCIAAVVLFYIIQMITMLMARFGTIPPIMGAWFPVVLFVIISLILLKYAKT